MNAAESFAQRVCARFNWPPSEYSRRVFWHCVPPERRPFVALLIVLRPSLFAFDFELIDALAACQSRSAFEAEARLSVLGVRERSVLRDGLRLRVSRTRLSRLAEKVWGRHPSSA